MWQLRYSPKATTGIYTIRRGLAANVSEAIKALVKDPRAGEPVIGRFNTYQIVSEGYTVMYELTESDEPQLIVVLSIE
jgi:plasmid stabilization system protein ParE